MAITLARSHQLDQLSGTQKAAILCMVLGSEGAAMITQKLGQEEVEQISFEIARMDRVSTEATEAVLAEWLDVMTAADSIAAGGIEYAREVLEKAFGATKAQSMLKRIQSQITETAGLHRLRNADPQQLGNMMRGEHPQTVALILAHLEPPHTASVLKELDPDFGSEVVLRIARMEKVSPDMLMLIERSILTETDLAPAQGLTTSGGPAAVAEVLNLVGRSLEKALMQGVEERDQALCDQIRNLMFVFEDVVSLDDRSLQRLLREIDVKELALALKAATNEVRNKIMGAMSQRASAALKEEMEMLGPARKRDIESAQTAIVAMIRKLEDAGEIVVGGGNDDLVV
ncbi:MAG TPA: flagellar motor switch protein FliG [Gemmatimonadaceae bacterium]|nr:flagellar motor switch protein FliG [Gemmatimonadaceae bacterium]